MDVLVGIRELKQNASEVIRRVKAGESVTVTERGEPVAVINPIRLSRMEELIAAGLLRPPTGDRHALPPPRPADVSISEVLREMRDAERS